MRIIQSRRAGVREVCQQHYHYDMLPIYSPRRRLRVICMRRYSVAANELHVPAWKIAGHISVPMPQPAV